jgi:hypothetical protein
LGLFSGLSKPVEEISTSNRVKPGSYEFQITDITHLEFDANHQSMPNQEAVVFELTIIDGDNESELGKKFSQFLRYPNEEEQGEKAEMFGSILKGFMLAVGIPESKLETWDPENPDDVDALIGARGTGRIAVNKKNKEFDNLFNFKLIEESGIGDTNITTNVGDWK